MTMAEKEGMKPRKRSRSIGMGDLLRIPVGIFFIYLAVTAVCKATVFLSKGVLGIAVFILAIAVTVTFAGIGLVMAVGPLVDRKPRRSKKRKPPPKQSD